MSLNHQTPEFIESDNPGREINYPQGVTEIIFGQFGFQAPEAGHAEEFISTSRRYFALENGPARVERCHGVSSGVHEDILIAYWLSRESYENWLASSNFPEWWESLSPDGPFGYWREIVSPDIGRVGGVYFGLASDRHVGLTSLLGAPPTQRWGYWGGYRDRMRASQQDSFEPELGVEPLPRRRPNTLGRRVIVDAPNNILLVREGQESTYVTGAIERKSWDTEVKPALAKWIKYLAENPELSGALVVREVAELELETGESTEKLSQLIYFQSLRHLERAARTQPSHVALYNSYMKMLGEVGAAGETAQLVVWVDQFLVQTGRMLAEYINCDPQLGLLPWFDAVDS
ncbi:phenylacetaldoxime dehydratase family protein [Hansschlegelia plantiphila]|uniref:Phenylacetaldoxime dehydratase n=1 Tax=Hansschlegelia plantiphila TaxID=374655 RepID=A0A9W6J1M3_9HYPH|nr:phenylacetaldoxime dehydratase family protein [Hansschlegelia plantiphila]GLK67619.1 hypothetical protein GCM10008179_12570 [Hansschlegelia plantiphila]